MGNVGSLGTSRPFRSALGSIIAVFFVLSLRASAQESSERIVILDEYHPNAETEGAFKVEDITMEIMEKGGANTPIEGLRQVPFVLGTTATENDSSGGNGTAFINLFALGPENTLTLVNGRRAFAFSNVNAIPIGAVERAQITNAAISVGSDSSAGTVNFMMLSGPGERPYEGAELYALYGNTTDADAHVRQVYLRGGITGLDGKVSIAAVGEYYSRANLFSRDREISRTGDRSNNPTGLGLGGENTNSPTYGGRISVLAGASSLGFTNTGQLVLLDLTTSQVMPGSYRRFDATLDPSQFNFRAFTPAIPAVEKAMYYVTGRYKILGDGLQLYGDVMYSKTKQDNGSAGTPFTINAALNGLTEARASRFNPAGNFLNSVRYRLQQELGNRESFFDQDYQRYVAGINGELSLKNNGFISRFAYDSGFVYEHFREQRTDSGDVTRSGIRQAIAGLDLNGDGVPETFFNPFIGQFAPIVGDAPTYVNGVPTGTTSHYDNRAGAQFASYTARSFSLERDFLYDTKVNMHLFPNLWNGGLDLTLGGEHRESQIDHVPDPTQVAGDQIVFSATPNTKDKRKVDSFFGEIIIPIITPAMKVSGVRSLEVISGFRSEQFHDEDQFTHTTATFDNDGTLELGLRYQPGPELMLRASWRQSTRPPTFDDLFAPMTQVFPPLFGLPEDTKFLDVVVGGNPNLSPEKTDTYSAGVVWSPQFAPRLMVTADWYQLFTTDLILNGVDFAQVLVIRNTIAPINNFSGCDDLTNIGLIRDPNDGTVFCINSPTGNAGKRHVQGLDVTATYEISTERFGKFTVSGGWNHFFTWKTQPGVGTFNSFLGNYNNGTLPLAPGAIPWNKGFLRGEWEWRHFDFVATGNYIGDFRDDPAFNGFQIGGPDYTGRIRTVPSYITLDLQLSYEFVKPDVYPEPAAQDWKSSKNGVQTAAHTSSIWQRLLWGTKLTVGVNNAFDRNPPTVLGAFNDNYDTSLYTIRNRYYYVALTKKF